VYTASVQEYGNYRPNNYRITTFKTEKNSQTFLDMKLSRCTKFVCQYRV